MEDWGSSAAGDLSHPKRQILEVRTYLCKIETETRGVGWNWGLVNVLLKFGEMWGHDPGVSVSCFFVLLD